MDLPRTIVVGTDFSDQADAAVAYAIALAGKLDARVQLVHGWQVPPTAIGPDLATGFVAPFAAELERSAREAMARTLDRVRKGAKVPIDGAVVCNDPRDAVLAEAASRDAQLIIVGTHGRRGLKRALLGSVAEAVVRLASCPVLVVRS